MAYRLEDLSAGIVADNAFMMDQGGCDILAQSHMIWYDFTRKRDQIVKAGKSDM